MTIYKITAISGAPKSAAKHVGRSVRIISLKTGEPCVMNYVDDPINTIWTPEVTYFEVKADTEEVIEDGCWVNYVQTGERVTVECGNVTYELVSNGKVGD